MKILAIVALGCAFTAFTSAQSSQEPKPSDDSQKVYRCDGQVVCPKVVSAPDPEYTDHARRKKWQGTTQLTFVVDESGNTKDIRVVKSLKPELDKQAIKCLESWKFRPGTKNGTPVEVQMTVSVTFSLY